MALLPTPRPERFAVTEEEMRHRAGMRLVPGAHSGSRQMITGDTMNAAATLAAMLGKGFSRDEDWAGADGETALQMAALGWSEGCRLVDDLFARVTARQTMSILPTLAYSDEPDGDIDVSQYLANEDECYLVEVPGRVAVPVSGRYLNIAVDIGALYTVNADDMLRRGVYVAALIYVLERSGFRVKVQTRFATSGGKARKRVAVCVDVKGFDQPLDLPRLMFWVAHPAALRQASFAACEAFGVTGNKPVENETLSNDVIHVSLAMTGREDLDAWFDATLRRVGITMEDAK